MIFLITNIATYIFITNLQNLFYLSYKINKFIKNLILNSMLQIFSRILHLTVLTLFVLISFSQAVYANQKNRSLAVYVDPQNSEIFAPTLPERIDSKIKYLRTENSEKRTKKNYSTLVELNFKNQVLDTITIPAANVYGSKMYRSSLDNLEDINKKLLDGPVVEEIYAKDVCNDIGHSYIYGHSEPTRQDQSDYKAARIFEDLELLKKGDIIELTNKNGKRCKYEVIRWDAFKTDFNQVATREQLNFAYFPEDIKGSSLTIQTCQKGSSTVRLLLRARRIWV